MHVTVLGVARNCGLCHSLAHMAATLGLTTYSAVTVEGGRQSKIRKTVSTFDK
jgi:hypothetical protein